MTTSKATNTSSITLTFDVFDLPTAQHKAGLAGLVLQIRSMQQRQREFNKEGIPTINELRRTSARLTFTVDSLQALFDDLYSARIVEVQSATKWPGKTQPKRIEEIEEETGGGGKKKKSKRFVYDVVQPNSPLLRQHFADGDGMWMKLWRDMIWAIPRGKPTTRGPFNDRAAGERTSEAAKVWKELCAFQKALEKDTFRTCAVSGALLLGAQAFNAESVPFRERSDLALLLHFWQLTVRIFVPQVVDNDGKGEFVGYSLAIPEITDLERFCEDYPRLLGQLDTKARGYRPAASVIDIPAQAALEFQLHLARLVDHAARQGRLKHSIPSIEYIHLVKVGNNVKSMARGRVAPDPELLDQYRAIVDAHPQPYRNPLFRAGLLTSLLNRQPWHTAMADMLVERPWPFFIRCADTPKSMPWFATDAAAKFQQTYSDHQNALEDFRDMSKANDELGDKPQTPLPLLIHRLIRNYVQRKTEERSGLKWENFKDKKVKDDKGRERIDVPAAYREAKEKVASDTFLAMRGRRDQDFSDYFTARICSVGQFLREEEFVTVAEALLNDPGEVKTLTLLALSANS